MGNENFLEKNVLIECVPFYFTGIQRSKLEGITILKDVQASIGTNTTNEKPCNLNLYLCTLCVGACKAERAIVYSPYEEMLVVGNCDHFLVLLCPETDYPGAATIFPLNNKAFLLDCEKPRRNLDASFSR